jgi:hypothetical protein
MNYIDGMDVLNVGLGAVLFDVNTQTYYTPNTDTKTSSTEETPEETPDIDKTQEENQDILR